VERLHFKLLLLSLIFLNGCATSSTIKELLTGEQFDEPVIEQSKFLRKDESELPRPKGRGFLIH
jgi:hypothetical protein